MRDRIIASMYNAGSNLVLLPIQDVFGWRDRVNLPATIGDDNWTYALPWPCDTLAAQPEAVELRGPARGIELSDGPLHVTRDDRVAQYLEFLGRR